jgi:hypothetical protein
VDHLPEALAVVYRSTNVIGSAGAFSTDSGGGHGCRSGTANSSRRRGRPSAWRRGARERQGCIGPSGGAEWRDYSAVDATLKEAVMVDVAAIR